MTNFSLTKAIVNVVLLEYHALPTLPVAELDTEFVDADFGDDDVAEFCSAVF